MPCEHQPPEASFPIDADADTSSTVAAGRRRGPNRCAVGTAPFTMQQRRDRRPHRRIGRRHARLRIADVEEVAVHAGHRLALVGHRRQRPPLRHVTGIQQVDRHLRVREVDRDHMRVRRAARCLHVERLVCYAGREFLLPLGVDRDVRPADNRRAHQRADRERRQRLQPARDEAPL